MKSRFIILFAANLLCSIVNQAIAQPRGIVDARVTTSPGGMFFSTNMQITSTETFAKDFDQYSMRPILYHGRAFAYGTEYNTKGNRMLLDNWAKGSVVKNSGEEISGEKYFFNFDKITNNLLVTVDKNEVIEVYKDSIQSFTFSQGDHQYSFEKVPSILKYRFVQSLVKNKEGYSLYKSIGSKLIRADFNTNGLTETGQPYDEYVDNSLYYILYKDQVRPVQLKFTSIKKSLPEKSSGVKDFYADHLMDEVNEDYLISIVNYLNR